MNMQHYMNGHVAIQPQEFAKISSYLYQRSGIVLKDGKQAMVSGRLVKRLHHHGLSSYSQYLKLLEKPEGEQEAVVAVDLLTTNETYFFRESRHFEFLQQHFFPVQQPGRPLRFWSAASSSGEEAFTLAMSAAEYSPTRQWEVVGTDLSTRVLDKARSGLYPLSAAEKIPQPLLKKYCLKGNGEYEGQLLIDPALRRRVKFFQANLVESLPDLGLFDVIFLRNVMIYFDMPTKQRLVQRILHHLRPGGYLIVSHSESLSGMNSGLQTVSPSIYRKL